ncbi:hypothetical protein Ndes2526B_g08702 [Nannochloris sp. 'desiccata']|nr:hypothetical protein NADE_001419 [Chlorella desiccata (nom. nud.)]
MANLELTIHEAQRQLAEIERQADNLLATLSNTAVADAGTTNTPHIIVTNAMNALQGYEAALTKLQPVLDSVTALSSSGGSSSLPPAVVDALWKKAYPNERAFSHSNKQTKAPPPGEPATALEALIATFQENFGQENIKIEILHLPQQKQQQHRRLTVNFKGTFVAHILLETTESLGKGSCSLDVVPIDIDIKPPVPFSAISATRPQFVQQLQTAGTIAVLEMKDTRDEFVAPLEMLLLWLALCAVRIKSSNCNSTLEMDLSSGSFVRVFPKFSELVWKEAWEHVSQQL